MNDKYNDHLFDMSAKQKKDDNNTPYLPNKSVGSGLPDRKTTIQKFTRPSKFNFNMKLEKTPVHRDGYHVANNSEVKRLNKYATNLVDIASFYRKKLAEGKIYYVYKDQDNHIKTFGVKYGEQNFSHLTGLIFDRKSAKQMLDELSIGKLSQNAILVKNDGTTFDKLAVIDELNSLNTSKIQKLDNIKNVRQADNLHFKDAIKSNSDNYLVAYRYFEPQISRPISLINLNKVRKGYSDYSSIPSNQVLAVLSETPNQMGGLSMGTLSINHKYLKSGEQLAEITGAMHKLILNDYMHQKTQSKSKNHSLKKKVKRPKER